MQTTLHILPSSIRLSSKDWDGDKVKVREQRSLIDFKLVDTQVTDTTQGDDDRQACKKT